jgi:hypothetical protein
MVADVRRELEAGGIIFQVDRMLGEDGSGSAGEEVRPLRWGGDAARLPTLKMNWLGTVLSRTDIL